MRRLTLRPNLVDFFSNDYLGLARNKKLYSLIDRKLSAQTGNINGSTGSRLLSGNSDYVEELELFFAKLFKSPKALIFNSGYNANLSILSAIPQKEDTIIYDELIHASLKDGARLSFAQRFSFKHNDLKDLEAKIQKAKGEVYVAVESVYSMDGDFAPLLEILELTTKYDAHLIVDEAHSTGVWGEKGNGMCCHLGIEDKVFARVYTFGKGIGAHGACIAGSELLIEFLINFARPFIYTTSLPLHSLVTLKVAFEYLEKEISLQAKIRSRIKLFRSLIEGSKILSPLIQDSSSPIQVLRISGNEKAKAAAAAVQNNGFDVRAILSPTVKEGEERLRICLHVFNTDEEIERLVKTLVESL
ncbi:8-amino-7-oxononanoate synthase [Sporocytophaga myxococcoides]|uniref:8-amino-7-oxononanoate synthase n=1 Tax=Sporocytophaga myxococcoides TaxID=153721 RepID=A0A098LDT8_9BACT|nr:8-amino-7-oxononanoate synthase [Sporocytophaga myxococcoides]